MRAEWFNLGATIPLETRTGVEVEVMKVSSLLKAVESIGWTRLDSSAGGLEFLGWAGGLACASRSIGDSTNVDVIILRIMGCSSKGKRVHH